MDTNSQEVKPNKKWNDLSKFMEENYREFQPFIHYNEVLDTITVKLRDCSTTVISVNKYLSLLQPNHGKDDKPVGFIINYVRSLLLKNDYNSHNCLDTDYLIKIAFLMEPDQNFAAIVYELSKNEELKSLKEFDLNKLKPI